ncbi:hypothetical protein NDU88_001340 [Pleurodeles waltl]|uniref:Uncharacterized protein n=1 Tax=Pleurodeles waltl TaxID=8319 RepID=A0AAV7V7X7_PLEWA|nr:hypothetical protein NDU88_001340 [Pleurodeles waltl]
MRKATTNNRKCDRQRCLPRVPISVYTSPGSKEDRCGSLGRSRYMAEFEDSDLLLKFAVGPFLLLGNPEDKPWMQPPQPVLGTLAARDHLAEGSLEDVGEGVGDAAQMSCCAERKTQH